MKIEKVSGESSHLATPSCGWCIGGKITLFVLDVLAIGSVHLPATSHVRGGLTRHRSALCIVVGGCSWALHAVVAGSTCRPSAQCVVVTGPYSSSLVGLFSVVGSRSRLTHRRWNVARPYSFSLGLVVVSVLLFVVGSVPSFWHHSRNHGGGGLVMSSSIRWCWAKRRRWEYVVRGKEEREERRKRTTTLVVVRFGNVLSGPPISWVPLVYIIP